MAVVVVMVSSTSWPWFIVVSSTPCVVAVFVIRLQGHVKASPPVVLWPVV